MDFAWDVEQDTFRSTVRAFLAAHLPSDWESLAHGPGTEIQSKFSKKFCGELAKAGLMVPHWSARWGGRDADPWTAFILAEEMWEAGEPRGGQYMNVNWIGPTLMRFGSMEIDRDARTVAVGGKPCELTSYQFDLLVVLAERAGRVLTRDQIMEAVRGRELEAFDRSIDVHMGRIRAAIEVDAKNPKRILTVRGVGYVFAKQQD